MRRLLTLAARLYPGSWRARYGAEFDALLEDIEPSWLDVWNVLNGALMMNIRRGFYIPAALAVIGAIVGGAISMTMPNLYRSSTTFRLAGVDRLVTRTLLERTFAPGNQPVDNVHPSRISVLVDDDRSNARGYATLVLATYDADARQAQSATQHLVDALAKAVDARRTTNPSMTFEPIDPPDLPLLPSSPNRVAVAGTGGGAGLFLGGVVAWIRRRRQPS